MVSEGESHPIAFEDQEEKEVLTAFRKRMSGFGENGVGYKEVKDTANQLQELFDSVQPEEIEDLRFFVSTAQRIDAAKAKYFNGLTSEEIGLHTDRGQIHRTIVDIQYRALDKIPIEKLSSEEREMYIKSMVEAHGEFYDEYRGCYYYFGFPAVAGFEKPDHQKLLEAVIKDKEKVLTDKEIEIVYRAEKNTYKIHLSVPPGKKLEVLKAILEVQQKDNQIVTEIFAEKKVRGERVSASRSEIRSRGGKLASLNQYKMSVFDFDSPLFADFVFYPRPVQGQTAEESVVEMAHELKSTLSGLELPKTDRLPRFSAPIVISGEEVPGMSYVQGNGDFKLHLLTTRGANKLGEYYDEDKNYAVRKGEQVNFDKQ